MEKNLYIKFILQVATNANKTSKPDHLQIAFLTFPIGMGKGLLLRANA